jgi:hypothetical protein
MAGPIIPETWPMVNRIVPCSSPGCHGLALSWAFAFHTTLVLGEVPTQDARHLRGLPLACAARRRDCSAFNPVAMVCRLVALPSCRVGFLGRRAPGLPLHGHSRSGGLHNRL